MLRRTTSKVGTSRREAESRRGSPTSRSASGAPSASHTPSPGTATRWRNPRCAVSTRTTTGRSWKPARPIQGQAGSREKGVQRQDREAVQELIRQLQPLSEATREALATSLIVATPALELQHPLGVYHQDCSYESRAAARIRELLGIEDSDNGGGPSCIPPP